MSTYRTHTCGELREQNERQSVTLAGWLYHKRNHGGVLFLDIRDDYGITQCVISTENVLFPSLETISLESVVQIHGTVKLRDSTLINTAINTGKIEVSIEKFEVINPAKSLPFPVSHDADYPEDIRFRYRYLDLRLPANKAYVVLRSQIIDTLRAQMQAQGFMEFQTPILSASSPEGARDFVVPSRLYPSMFYALPQAPQIYKQLVMASGFDKYFQIAPCFRDEDSRQDRAPGEFYQLDLEMAFATQEEVFTVLESVLSVTFEKFCHGFVVDKPPFPRISFHKSLELYGTDKPDLRNPLTIKDVSAIFKGSPFKLFDSIVQLGGVVKAITVPNGNAQGRAYLDKMNSWAQKEGQKGMGYINIDAGTGVGLGPVAKNLGTELTSRLITFMGAKLGDVIFFGAGNESTITPFMGKARTQLGEAYELIEQNCYQFVWITNFPMYELSPEGDLMFSHNPFSMPQGGMQALQEKNPLDVLAYQYDIVCNGIELSSGAERNYREDIMYKAFEIAGYDKAFVQAHFPAFVEAFQYGTPPSAGSAPGIDRIVMLLAGSPNIREVTLFPKNQTGQDLMLKAPAPVSKQQLKDVHIQVVLPKKNNI